MLVKHEEISNKLVRNEDEMLVVDFWIQKFLNKGSAMSCQLWLQGVGAID